MPIAPTTRTTSRQGASRILNTFSDPRRGLSRILNTTGVSRLGLSRVGNLSIQGWAVWIGQGTLPDLTVAPDGFGVSLPVSVMIAPPGMGVEVLYVVTRFRNQYGLYSQNQFARQLRINSSGAFLLNPLLVPILIDAAQTPGPGIQIRASYPTVYSDANPADTWKFWIQGGIPPNPLVDPPTATSPVSGDKIVSVLSPYASGVIWHIAVALYRTVDGAQSPAATATLTVLAAPPKPATVFTGRVLP